MTETTALLIYGHPPDNARASGDFVALAQAIAERFAAFPFAIAGTGASGHSLETAIGSLVDQGANRIVCLSCSLPTSPLGQEPTLPGLQDVSRLFPGISIRHCSPLAVDAKLLKAACDQIETTEAAAARAVSREDSLLMVVGPGGGAVEANADLAKLARMLWEGMGFGWTEVSFLANAFPSLEQGLDHAVKLDFKRIIVFPYFLFHEASLDNLAQHISGAAARHPEIEFLETPHLKDHAPLADGFAARVFETVNGSTSMNCMQCTYRDQIIGPDHDHEPGHGPKHRHQPGHSHGASGAADKPA